MKFTEEQKQSISYFADMINVPYAALAAIVEVESNGVAGAMIGNRFEPIIRYEGHYFDKLCPPNIREAARAAGVSAKSAGVVKNPASQANRWKLLLKAATFHAGAAYQSASYGVGQVMGSHWKLLGYKTVDEFVAKARSGFKGQVEIMVQFIEHFGLDDELRNLDWSGFARGYNGPAYAKNKYDVNMEKAYYRHGGVATLSTKISGTLRLGSKGAGVRDVQALLNVAGFKVNVDGDFGPDTKEQVKLFQKEHRLTVDGIVGPKTQELLSNFRAVTVDKPGQEKLVDIDLVKKGFATAVATPAVIQSSKDLVQSTVDQLSPYAFLNPLVQYLNTALAVITVVGMGVGIGIAVYGWYKSKKTDTGTKSNELDYEVEDLVDAPIELPLSTGPVK